VKLASIHEIPPSPLPRVPIRLTLERLIEKAEGQTPPDLDFGTPIDREAYFICPTMTPLYHTELYDHLAEAVRRRYNQLTALSLIELTLFFEEEIATVLLRGLSRWPSLASGLRTYLRHFEEEEARHAGMWRTLLALTEPDWYEHHRWRFLRPGAVSLGILHELARHPRAARWMVWIVLAMEELSLASARRTRHASVSIEPRYRAAYLAHQEDEIRHAQIDWYLIEELRAVASSWGRRIDARIVRWILRRYFLAPVRAGQRVLRELAVECPEIAPLLPEITEQYRCLDRNSAYQAALYSRESHPILFTLFDAYEEFHGMSSLLLHYRQRTDEQARGEEAPA